MDDTADLVVSRHAREWIETGDEPASFLGVGISPSTGEWIETKVSPSMTRRTSDRIQYGCVG